MARLSKFLISHLPFVRHDGSFESKLSNFLISSLHLLGEHRLYQFRNVLIVGSIGHKERAELESLFNLAKIYDYGAGSKSPGKKLAKGKVFDLLISVDDRLSLLPEVLETYRTRLIVIRGELPDWLRNRDIKFVSNGMDFSLCMERVCYFDMFIPVGPKDYPIAESTVKNKRDKLKNLREIFYCSEEDLGLDAVWVSEEFFPMSLDNFSNPSGSITPRSGWYYQQLKQLYFPVTEKSCLDRVISICADVFMNNDVDFFRDGVPIVTMGRESPHQEYFKHMKRFYPLLRCFDSRSAISHHGVFERDILARLHRDIEFYHQKPFYSAFIDAIDPGEFEGSGAAEYEIYFNYLRLIGREILIREPNYIDTGSIVSGEQSGMDYFAYHWYMRG